MKPPVPGLRPIHYSARSAAKVNLVVQPGDHLMVSDDVAEQLLRASQQFKAETAAAADEAPDDTETEAPADEDPVPARPRRRTAKK